VLESIAANVSDLADNESATRVAERVAQMPAETLAAQCDAGALLLGDILAQLARPGRDPREDLPPPIFKKGVIKLDDLSPGMELSGTVLNVVDFGAFVDIGLHDTGLVHISQLANKYVRDPHEVVSVGDTVKVWVHEIDKTRRRVSLTMIAPGTPRGNERRGSRPKRGEKPQQPTAGNGEPATAAAGTAEEPARPAGGERRGPPRERSGPGHGHSRPPRRGDQSAAGPGSEQGRPPRPKFKSGPPRKPKPLVPITSAMKEGREPLRTFGDLKQFLELKTPDVAPDTAEHSAHGETASPGTASPNTAAENNAREHAAAQGHGGEERVAEKTAPENAVSENNAARPPDAEQTLADEPSAG
jgi:uncharacterized protein